MSSARSAAGLTRPQVHGERTARGLRSVRPSEMHPLDRCPWVHRYDFRRKRPGAAYEWTKRIIDVACAALALACLLPILTMSALAIKLGSPRDPVLFIQERTGLGGRRFRLYKFRTMLPGAEELKQHLLGLNELEWPDFKIERDPRITRVGHILRKTSLDELPQLINVLKGDMSLVGPRPISVPSREHVLWQTERLQARPGLSGLWQVSTRASVVFDDRSRLDIAYVRRRCFMLDAEILIRTIPSLFGGRAC